MAGVFSAEAAALLQQRHHPVDEVVKPAGREVWYQDEAVTRIRLHMQIDLVGHLSRRADELLTTGDGDDQFTDAEVLRLGAFPPCGGDRLRITVSDPALRDGRIVGRFDIR